MVQHLKISLHITALVAVTSLLLFSCKKEDAKSPYTDIVSFTVTAEGQPLKAAVTGDSVILYWPVEKQIPDSITPVIVVSPGATVSPASGTQVAAKGEVVYKVTSQTGISKQYKLYFPNNYPQPVIRTFSGITTYNDKKYVVLGSALYVNGDNFNSAENGTSVVVVTTDGKEKETRISYITPLQVQFAPLEKGNYKGYILRSNGYELTGNAEFAVIDNPRAALTVTGAISAKRGGELTVSGINLTLVTAFRLRQTGTSAYITIPVKSATATSLTATIPADLAAGAYDRIQLAYGATDYAGAGTVATVVTLTIAE